MHGYSAFELRPKGRREAMSRVSSDCSRTLPQALSDSHDQSRIGWYLSAYRVVAPPFYVATGTAERASTTGPS